MKLLLIRHGDPDYAKDWLTPKGLREAEFLAEKISRQDVKEVYVSPLGRAKATASCTLKRMGREAVELEWLREFPVKIHRPDFEGEGPVAWDGLPQDWMQEDEFFDEHDWGSQQVFQEAKLKAEYDRVIAKFDQLLNEHGYERDGRYYRVHQANRDTIVFFCHFGLECVLLSHLLNVSPMILWHGFCAAPTSVTTVITEERRQGIASFRINGFGDISHLYVKDEEPAFAARFCECFDNVDERHD